MRDGREIAIEVQLAQKSRDRAISMLMHLTQTYDGAWIFVRDGGPAVATERAVRELDPDGAQRIRLLPLEEP